MKDQNASFPQDLPWGSEDPEIRNDACSDEYYGEDVHGAPWEPTLTIDEVSHLLDQMVMDIQHLEVELVRTRYRLSFYLKDPYDEYLRMELFSSMGGRYQGNPAFDEYIRYRGFSEGEDAIDTPFHVSRMLRLADGHDDYPDMYP